MWRAFYLFIYLFTVVCRAHALWRDGACSTCAHAACWIGWRSGSTAYSKFLIVLCPKTLLFYSYSFLFLTLNFILFILEPYLKKKTFLPPRNLFFFFLQKKKKTSKQGDKTVCIEMVETLYKTHRQFIYCMDIYKDVHNFLN